ncbi:MAG: insulinase family protein [Acidobacteria bacterium]|nr:insulinase family protein [Acidobacteriota bacterium]
MTPPAADLKSRLLLALGSFIITLFASSIAAFPGAPPAPAPPAAPDPATIEASAVLPLDRAIRSGKLENGLSYFIRRNARPEKRAEMWLAVNAGSTLEDDDQLGLAHFVEHMAFNGTRHFKKHELVDALERMGMRFGPDINAYTSFDETVYTILVPTDDPANVDRALLILEDWAGAVSFETTQIEKERGVVIEEWRVGRGAEARMRDRQFPVLFHGSRYADRLTIGKKAILESASPDTIRRFYRDWYRPDLMAVIAVGDIDPEKMEVEIRKRFAGLKNPKKERARTVFPVPDHDETLVAVATDSEATSTSVAVDTLLPRSGETAADYRRSIVERLYHFMLNDRLDELRRAPDPPFLSAFSSGSRLTRSREAEFQRATVEEKGIARGLDALLTEQARVEKHGFTPTELERVKANVLRGYERAYDERDKQESGGLANEILDHFLEGEPAPGIEFELGLARRFLPTISLQEINGLARDRGAMRNRVVLVNAPEKKDIALPEEKEIVAAFDRARAKPIDPWVDRVRQEPLVASPPKPATLVDETEIASAGATRWRLSNGVTVILKPTDFKNDQVLLTGFSPGGTSVVTDARYVSAALSSSILSEGGLGSFDSVELEKALTGKIASAFGFLGDLEEGISAFASPRDLETMFQLAYLRFTAPRADAAAFQTWKSRMKGFLENRLARPENVFADRMSETMSQGHFRRRPLSVATLDEADLGTAEAVWRDRFADASDFTFVIVGAFGTDAIRPLVMTWLGGLPSTGRVESWKDVGVRAPDGVLGVEVRKGIEPKSQVRLVFTGEAPWSRDQSQLIGALASALRIRLREILREDMGGVYGVGVSGGLARRPREEYGFTITFGCDPGRVEELLKATLDSVETVKKDGASADVVAKVKEQQVRAHETDLRENGYWMSQLAEAARYGETPWRILEHERLVGLVTSEALRDAARRYLNLDRRVVGVLYPEKSADASEKKAP